MNDEIKEILEHIQYVIDEDDYWEVTKATLKPLLDYITNLQQENEDNLKCIKSIKEQLESVINENQRLLNKWFENNDKMVELIGEKTLYNESLKDYKSRIEKVVEILKDTNVDMPSTLLIETIDNGINILNGRSDE